jgi:hypothetical protein
MHDILKQYRVTKVVGDAYGGEFPRSLFRKFGINYEVSELHRSELYTSFLPLVNARAVDLLDSDRMVQQFTGLQRRTSRSGKDAVEKPRGAGAHDDVAMLSELPPEGSQKPMYFHCLSGNRSRTSS